MSQSIDTGLRTLASRCHALADETRLKIIDLLLEGERCGLRPSQGVLSGLSSYAANSPLEF